MDETDRIEEGLWSQGVTPDNYPSGKYQDHLIDQYKLYVEMADRISQRRSGADFQEK